MLRRIGTFLSVFLSLVLPTFGDAALRIGVFDVDASPPVGSPLAYDPTTQVLSPLSCRGVILLSDEKPVVLCAVDWIGIANEGQTEFRSALAKAAGTTPQRVAVHTLHQHDAPKCDFSADLLLAQYGINQHLYDTIFARDVIRRAASAVAEAIRTAQPVTHVGLGAGIVEKVASNRRILGPDGKVKHVRWTATSDPAIRALPVGTIDPVLKMISFWRDDQPVVVLTYYATHPQSYYRTGKANPDFPGMARNSRQQATGVPHIHFNGAGGNIGAGKWNDGSHENRQRLADRVAAGMTAAWKVTKKHRISVDDLRWRSIPIKLPAAAHLDEKTLLDQLANQEANLQQRFMAASDLIWLRRCQAGDSIDLACLTIGNARILHAPGELFVEYQLAAQRLRPDLFIAMAAYGDYGPGYIGTEIAYSQGGYETSPTSSRVVPHVEHALMDGLKQHLKSK